MQTDAYLEELTERVVEFEAETQTDFLLDRPQSPLFMPAKVGVDTTTQVEPGELFDFDREVEPVLELLVGKTLEHGMMEVLEEEELASIRRQILFEETRHAELLDVQRMEAAEKRRDEEKARRMAQEKARDEQQKSVFKKAHSRVLARSYLGGIGRKSLGMLESEGLFIDQVEVAVESRFLPWLVDSVSTEMARAKERQEVLESLVNQMAEDLAEPHRKALEEEAQRRHVVAEAERKFREDLAEEMALKQQHAARKQREAAVLAEYDDHMPDPPVVEAEEEEGEGEHAEED